MGNAKFDAIGLAFGAHDAAAIRLAFGGRMSVDVTAPANLSGALHRLQGRHYGAPRVIFTTDDPAEIESARELAAITGAHVIPPRDKARTWGEHADAYTTRGTIYALGQSCPPEVARLLPDLNEASPPASAGVAVAPVKAPKGGGYGTPPPAAGVSFVRGSEIPPEPVDWLWFEWLARGKFHLLAGAPGCGKTMIAMSLAAALSVGGKFPDGAPCGPARDVLIWSAEDDPRDTLIPRLMLSGADMSRILFPDKMHGQGEPRPFDPACDLDALAATLARPEYQNVGLLIVDPIVSAVAGDSHKNAEVRRHLQPLVDMAAARRIAVLGITHLSKGTGGRDPNERVTGSLAFAALARVVLMAAKPVTSVAPTDPRMFFRSKSNIGSDTGGVEYFIEQGEVEGHPGCGSSFASFGGRLEGTGRELMARADAEPEAAPEGRLGEACEVLRELLANGPRLSSEIEAEAAAHGVNRGAYDRARKKLGIKARPRDGAWWVELPLDPSGGAVATPRTGRQETQGPQETQEHKGHNHASLGVSGRSVTNSTGGGHVDL